MLDEVPGNLCDEAHGLPTAGARPGRFGRRRSLRLIAGDIEDHAGEELDALAVFLGGGMEESVVAHGMHLGREHVAEVAPDKLDAIESFSHFDAAIAIFPAEGDRVVIDGDDAAVSDGGACDVGAEVFDSRGA